MESFERKTHRRLQPSPVRSQTERVDRTAGKEIKASQMLAFILSSPYVPRLHGKG